MAYLQLLVSPEALVRTSEEMDSVLHRVRVHALRIEEISGRTQGYWQGEAGQRCREVFSEDRKEIFMSADRLAERSKRLLRLAGIYQNAEAAVEESGAALSRQTLQKR